MSDTTKQRTKKAPPQRNISSELFEAWGRLKRNGDPIKMAKRFGMCRAPFDIALNHGYIARDETAQYINLFFKERLTEEQSQAASLNELSKETEVHGTK